MKIKNLNFKIRVLDLVIKNGGQNETSANFKRYFF